MTEAFEKALYARCCEKFDRELSASEKLRIKKKAEKYAEDPNFQFNFQQLIEKAVQELIIDFK